MSIKGHLSEAHKVTSGIPQGSVLGPTLFVTYVNDIPGQLMSPTLLFADDVKIYKVIDPQHKEQCIAELQGDLATLSLWVLRWLISIHPEKCKVMSVNSGGLGTSEAEYYLASAVDGEVNIPIKRVTQETDLGITVDSGLAFDKHIDTITSKANKIVGVIRRAFTYLEPSNFRLLFRALVRPHLEYGQAVWKPYRRGHINKLESVQRRATKQLPGYTNLPYSERLKRLNLPTLAFRRLRGDAIEVFKILSGRYDINASANLLQRDIGRRTRGPHSNSRNGTVGLMSASTSSHTGWSTCGTLYRKAW